MFETGPRTLRANSVAAMVTLDMVCSLNYFNSFNCF